MSEKLLIFQKSYDLALWLYPTINRIPKSHRLVLGRHLEELLLRFLTSIPWQDSPCLSRLGRNACPERKELCAPEAEASISGILFVWDGDIGQEHTLNTGCGTT